MTVFDPARFSDLVRNDAWLRSKLAFMDQGSIQITTDHIRIAITVREGQVVDVGKPNAAPDILLRIPAPVWAGLAENPPMPGYESATMARRNGLVIEGDLERFVAPFHPAIERIYMLLGEAIRGPRVVLATNAEPFRHTDDPVGRYRWITVGGTDFRVYYETAGTGPVPMLLQHTAGCDGRQWRHLLADPVLQRDFTMIAYDLPYHGRSLPPTGEEWWHSDYRVDQRQLMDWVLAISDALGLDRPVFMGCSVGGQLALDLAAFHPSKFCAFVALNGWHDMRFAKDFSNDRFRNPRVSNNLFASSCYAATSPIALEAHRQESYWIYRSNFPGIYAGDNDYFMHQHDFRRDGEHFDPAKTKVYLLSGSYDPCLAHDDCGPQEIVRRFPGVRFRILEGLSHFAPSDDPERFSHEIRPILAEIAAGN